MRVWIPAVTAVFEVKSGRAECSTLDFVVGLAERCADRDLSPTDRISLYSYRSLQWEYWEDILIQCRKRKWLGPVRFEQKTSGRFSAENKEII
jgi:hypothetical protein